MQKALRLLCPSCREPFEVALQEAVRDVLTPTQWRVFRAVDSFPGLDIDDLTGVVYSDDLNGGPLTANNTISVHICKANRRLRPLGLRIAASHPGQGAVYNIHSTGTRTRKPEG